MHWTWDREKDRINRRKHRISFHTAILIFEDRSMWAEPDPYPYEERWRSIGIASEPLTIVIHTWPNTEQEPGRIISARRVTNRDRRLYEEGNDQTY